jgi:hypothetical protein
LRIWRSDDGGTLVFVVVGDKKDVDVDVALIGTVSLLRVGGLVWSTLRWLMFKFSSYCTKCRHGFGTNLMFEVVFLTVTLEP